MPFKKGDPKPTQSGRQRGTPNRATAAKAEAIAASGEAPADFMVRVMRDPQVPLEIRLDAAKAAANYFHPRLAAIDVNFGHMTDDELRAALAAELASTTTGGGTDTTDTDETSGAD